jgi:hypothetical protein
MSANESAAEAVEISTERSTPDVDCNEDIPLAVARFMASALVKAPR